MVITFKKCLTLHIDFKQKEQGKTHKYLNSAGHHKKHIWLHMNQSSFSKRENPFNPSASLCENSTLTRKWEGST